VPARVYSPRIELDLRKRVFKFREPPLSRDVDAAEARAAPFGNRAERRVLEELQKAPLGPGVRRVVYAAVKFLEQTRLTQSRLAHDQQQLSVALPRPFPAPHQHGDFLVASDERRKMPLTRASPTTTRAYDPIERHRLRHALSSWLPRSSTTNRPAT
jgi:hypothetical protein